MLSSRIDRAKTFVKNHREDFIIGAVAAPFLGLFIYTAVKYPEMYTDEPEPEPKPEEVHIHHYYHNV